MIPLLLLAGCGEREARLNKLFSSLRDAMIAAERLTFTASLTADRGDTVESYSLAAEWDGQRTSLEILAPELIAGVRASVKWGEADVLYEGVMLRAGPLDGEGLTPVSAVPAILAALAGGHVELLWWDGSLPAVRIYTGEDAACTVWLDPETGAPSAAEIASGGRTVISCGISDWILTPGQAPKRTGEESYTG
ncbi:MAG: hypothetical protein IKD79_04770 [Oscillospiraceae bacterium]|nr:hypothetical protein [Oscillospiraceae bacterium]